MKIVEKIVKFILALFNKKNKAESYVNQRVIENSEEKDVFEDIKKEKNNSKTNILNDMENSEEKIVLSGEMGVPSVEIKKYPNLVVVLDPGHALNTAGKKSPFSLGKVNSPELPFEEWQFNREIVYRLKSLLIERGIETFVTTDTERDGNNDLGLSKRAERGNDYVKKSGKRGVLISVHSDADGMGDKWTKAHGWSCFTTEGQNNSDKLADCLYDAAESIFQNISDKLTLRTDKKDGDRDWESNFTVLYKANMPAVLTENFFYTNIDDLNFITSNEGKDAIARVHLLGILKFADEVYGM